MPNQQSEVQPTETNIYKGYLLRVHRIGTFGAYTAFAMKLSAPDKFTPPFAGRIRAGEFKGKGAKRRALETVKSSIDAAILAAKGGA